MGKEIRSLFDVSPDIRIHHAQAHDVEKNCCLGCARKKCAHKKTKGSEIISNDPSQLENPVAPLQQRFNSESIGNILQALRDGCYA
jgi:hypothetical protein